jgi:hypothetical protein
LETSQGTDHENSGTQTSPESGHADFAVDGFHVIDEGAFGLHVVQFRNPKS